MTKFLLITLALIGTLAVLCIETEAMSTGLRKRLNIIKTLQDHVKSARAVRETRREEDEEDEEEEEEDEEYEEGTEAVWGSKEDAEMFLRIFDLNRDSKLSKDELWEFFEALSYNDNEIKHILEKFSTIDADSDSYFSVDELMVAMQLSLL